MVHLKPYWTTPYWILCKCGHYNWQHNNLIIPLTFEPVPRAERYGKCNVEGCDCKHFTWMKRNTSKSEMKENE